MIIKQMKNDDKKNIKRTMKKKNEEMIDKDK